MIMLQSKLFKPFIITLFSVGLLELVTIKLHLFITIFWFDMVMHFFGGFLAGMFALWVLTWKKQRNFSYGQMLLWGMGMAFVIGIIWEVFELYFGITYIHLPDYWSDNGMDIIMDISGGLISVWYAWYKLKSLKGAS